MQAGIHIRPPKRRHFVGHAVNFVTRTARLCSEPIYHRALTGDICARSAARSAAVNPSARTATTSASSGSAASHGIQVAGDEDEAAHDLRMCAAEPAMEHDDDTGRQLARRFRALAI